MKELNTINQTAQVSKIILVSGVGGGGKGNDGAFLLNQKQYTISTNKNYYLLKNKKKFKKEI